MVLQRNTELKIWGWAAPNEAISVTFNKKSYQTKADAKGTWQVRLAPIKAGGPFEMKIDASNHIIIKDILVGDVWVCSGQSNMELTMERVKDKYSTIIASSENANIRQFLIPDKFDFKQPQADVESGSWIPANPKNLFSFSAIGYFFAKELYEKYRVPIGLINSALGGSPVEAWISEEALKKFPTQYEELQRFKNDKLIEEIETNDRNRNNKWYADLNAKDDGLNKWETANFNDNDWNETTIPGFWTEGPIGKTNGVVWFRRKVTVPKSMTGKSGKLWMGRIVDADSVFVNGKFVGTTSYQYPPRKYEFGEGLLKEGENTIAIRVINSGGRGGFITDKPYFIAVGNDTIDLKGVWKCKLGASIPPLEGGTTIRWKPTGLYNKMIAPLLNYKIKGTIWYQGEANTRRAAEYRELFPAMINDWRAQWKIGDFPFLFVQLANFMETTSTPVNSEWAELRAAQALTLEKCKNTAMVVATDVGEWNDIHPLNKQTVGKRLFLAAQHIAYLDKKVVYSGPTYQSMKVVGNKIELTFTNIGSGLVVQGGDLKYFAIAGTDRKFVWAKAKIEGNKVIVWNDEIAQPAVVRYAWANNPEGANLYNKEGLPASPFSTDKK
jgi:sialate O-acetylesterase